MFQRRLKPLDSPLARAATTAFGVVVALALAGALFLPFHADPLAAYAALLREGFGTMRGFGFTLVRAAPLVLVALGTCVAWRSGFGYLGFEGCFLVGAAATTIVALQAAGGLAPIPTAAFGASMLVAAFAAGGAWAGGVAWLRGRFGGNEVLMSLMTNYLAALLVQWLVSGPIRSPGDLPQSPRLPPSTWLPVLLPGTRAHAGIVLAILATASVWVLLSRTLAGYELIVTGANPRAARYAGIAVARRQLAAGVLAGGLAALAGFVEVLGVQHRLLDGMSGGVGFIGIAVALLARLSPVAVMPAALLYAAMTVGADAMQRSAGIPAAIVFILQSLIVLAVLAADLLLLWRPAWPVLRGRPR